MENESKPMNAFACLTALNTGGWMVTGGREIGPSGLTRRVPVLDASLVGDKIRIATAPGLSYEAPTSNIISSDNGQRIMILGVYTKNEQKKLLDGGGWREVEYTAPALKFQMLASLIEADHAREEKQRRAEEELKKWHEEHRRLADERARLWAEARKTRQEEFARELTGKFVGRTIVQIDCDNGGLNLKLDDGSELSVVVDWDYSNTEVTVNGVSLHRLAF